MASGSRGALHESKLTTRDSIGHDSAKIKLGLTQTMPNITLAQRRLLMGNIPARFKPVMVTTYQHGT